MVPVERKAATARAFGAGWAFLYLAVGAGAALLWTGIAGPAFARLDPGQRAIVRWAWPAALLIVAVVLPAFATRPGRRIRSFQVAALAIVVVALAGAIALRHAALGETVRAGWVQWEAWRDGRPTPAAPIAPASPASPLPAEAPLSADASVVGERPPALPPPAPPASREEAVTTWLTQDYLLNEGIPVQVPGYAQALTRESGRVKAGGIVGAAGLSTFLFGLTAPAQRPEDVERRAQLRKRVEELAKALPADGREALEVALPIQVALTAELATWARAEDRVDEATVRAQVKQEVEHLECREEGEAAAICRVDGRDFALAREDGAWRVDAARLVSFRLPGGPVKHQDGPGPGGCEQMDVEGACLRDALAELAACAPRGETARGKAVRSERGLQKATCTYQDGTVLEWSADHRLWRRHVTEFRLLKGGKPCGSFREISVGPRPKPGHDRNMRTNWVVQTDVETRSGRVVLREPWAGVGFDERGVCMEGCQRSLQCADGKVWKRPYSECVDSWRTSGGSGSGGLFSVTLYGQKEPFVRCETPNIGIPVDADTPVDLSGDPPLPERLRQPPE